MNILHSNALTLTTLLTFSVVSYIRAAIAQLKEFIFARYSPKSKHVHELIVFLIIQSDKLSRAEFTNSCKSLYIIIKIVLTIQTIWHVLLLNH